VPDVPEYTPVGSLSLSEDDPTPKAKPAAEPKKSAAEPRSKSAGKAAPQDVVAAAKVRCYSPRKVFGCSLIDLVRVSEVFYGALCLQIECCLGGDGLQKPSVAERQAQKEEILAAVRAKALAAQ
jgi:hypothetical protein